MNKQRSNFDQAMDEFMSQGVNAPEVRAEEPEVTVIKRYPNRKLYDTNQSCYVTLEEISGLVRQGNDVMVVDNKTKEDITTLTLLQIVFENERKKILNGDFNAMTLSGLNQVIRNG